jgi:hypothetical protein
VAITLNLLFYAIILLAAFWSLITTFTASRRLAYTLADWKSASDRICRRICQLRSATRPSPGGINFRRRTCNALLKDLLANTAFILNLVNDASRDLHRPHCLGCVRDVFSRAAGLHLRLYCVRVQLFLWPTSRRNPVTAAEGYTGLCLALTGFLESMSCTVLRSEPRKPGGKT